MYLQLDRRRTTKQFAHEKTHVQSITHREDDDYELSPPPISFLDRELFD